MPKGRSMVAMTAAQRKKEERRRDKDAGLKTWNVNIDNSTRESLRLLTMAYGTGSQEKTFLKLIGDALARLYTPQPVSAADEVEAGLEP